MLRFFALILLGSLFILGCSTDFELEGEWQDIPVVYGFLSVNDTAHYIRVERAFLEPGGNALDIAQIPDSIYYPVDELTVQLEKMGTGETYTLQRVDGNLEGYPRQDGTFASSPNFLYKIKASEILLEGGEEVRLILNRGDEKPLVTAETFILEPLQPQENRPASPINMRYDRLVTTGWLAGDQAQIFDVRYIFRYRETLPNDPTTFVEKNLEWVLDRELIRPMSDNEAVTIRQQGDVFYKFLGSAFPDTEDNIIRLFDGMDLIVVGGGQELVDFIEIQRANTGITSAQEVPTYSNLSEGFGVFTSRYRVTRNDLELSTPSLDSLRNGVFTRDLNFQ